MKREVSHMVMWERASAGLALINEALSLAHNEDEVDEIRLSVERVIGWHVRGKSEAAE